MGKRSKRSKQKAVAAAPHVEDQGQRLWESAETTRLNADQWSAVTNQPINYGLQQDLEILQLRCHHELHNNPMVEGGWNGCRVHLALIKMQLCSEEHEC